MIEHILTTHLNWCVDSDHRWPSPKSEPISHGIWCPFVGTWAQRAQTQLLGWRGLLGAVEQPLHHQAPEIFGGDMHHLGSYQQWRLYGKQGKYLGQSICNWEEWIYGCIQKGTPWGRVRWGRGKMSVRNTQIYDLCTLIRIQIKTLVDTTCLEEEIGEWMITTCFFWPPFMEPCFFSSISPLVKSQHFLRNPSGPSKWSQKVSDFANDPTSSTPKPQLGKGWVGETRLNSD